MSKAKRSPKENQPVLHKSVFEARYKPDLSFFDLMMAAAKKLDEFPHWETDQHSVTMKDFVHKCSCSLQLQKAGYEQDSSDVALEEARVAQILEAVHSSLGVTCFRRLGLRRFYLTPTSLSFRDLVKVLNTKLLSQNDRLRGLLPPIVEDLMYRVDMADDEHRFHITAGPLKKVEMGTYLNFNTRNHLKKQEDYGPLFDSYPSVGLFLDIDMFRESRKDDIVDIHSFLGAGRETIPRIAIDFSDYVLTSGK